MISTEFNKLRKLLRLLMRYPFDCSKVVSGNSKCLWFLKGWLRCFKQALALYSALLSRLIKVWTSETIKVRVVF